MKTYSSYAFFDLDATLLTINSMVSFLEYYYSHSEAVSKNERETKFRTVFQKFSQYMNEGKDRSYIYEQYFRLYKGKKKEEVYSVACKWWKNQLANSDGLFIPETLKAFIKHKEKNHGIVFVSGSLKEILRPIADHLEIDHNISTEIVQEDGVYTGHVSGEPLLGKGKQNAILDLLERYQVPPKNCYAYGDHISDLQMLETVSTPHVIKGDERLEKIAAERNWPVLENS